jgi:thiaminase/transcriptional activator TenA
MTQMTERGEVTTALWGDMEPLFEAILDHPFLGSLVEGNLPEDVFRNYVVQDAIYLKAYARALSALGGRAHTVGDTELFATRAARAIGVERTLHRELLASLGIAEELVEETEPSPTNLAYTSFIGAHVHGGSFADGLAAVVPCFWIYWEVASRLIERGSPHPVYRRWIESYRSEEFERGVRAVLELVDRVGAGLGEDDRRRMRRIVLAASRYEWMFWDAAWRLEGWPVETEPRGVGSGTAGGDRT